jgi:hypothetical protein
VPGAAAAPVVAAAREPVPAGALGWALAAIVAAATLFLILR